MTEYRTINNYLCAVFPRLFFEKFFVPVFFSLTMEATSRFAALARLNLPFYEYAGEFCKLAAATAWDDVTLNHLFWPFSIIPWTHHLGSVWARARTSPPLFAAPSSLPFAGKLTPPFAAPASPPPSAALPHTQPFAAKVGPPAVSMASPPAVPVASLPVAAPSRPVPAP